MRRALRFLPILFAAIAVGWVYLTSETFVNPETGRKSHVGLSEAQEQQLGLQSFREVVSHSPELMSTHPADETRINQLEQLMPAALEIYQKAVQQ
jgi:predicted Zn-dependent protease